MPTKAKKVKKSHEARLFYGVRFHGAAEVKESRNGRELFAYGTFEQAVELGVPLQAAAIAFGGRIKPGSAPGACRKFYNAGGFARCEPDHCEGTCHVFSVPKKWKFGDPFRDEGLEGDMDPDRIYFCSCTDKPIVY
jgi:hypothetical protein